MISSFLKIAAHAHDRMRQRTDLPESLVDEITKKIKDIKVHPGYYYSPITHNNETVAYAGYKTVGQNNKLVVATIYSAKMGRPRGELLFYLPISKS